MVSFLCFNTSLLCHFIRLKCRGYVYILPNISSSLPATINSTHAQTPKSPPHSKISSKPTSKNPHLSRKTPTNSTPQKSRNHTQKSQNPHSSHKNPISHEHFQKHTIILKSPPISSSNKPTKTAQIPESCSQISRSTSFSNVE